MSAESFQVLYVGSAASRFQACTEPLGWVVNIAQTRMEALGMFIFYLPQAVIVDLPDDSETAQDIYRHIRSVDNTPVLLLNGTDSVQLTSVLLDNAAFHEVSRLVEALVQETQRQF